MGDRNKPSLTPKDMPSRNCCLDRNATQQGLRAQVFCNSFWDCGCGCPQHWMGPMDGPLINPLNSIASVSEGKAGAQHSRRAKPLERKTRTGTDLSALCSHLRCLFL